MKPIIRVENLSKQYRIGAEQKPYLTVRESLVELAHAPLRAFRRSGDSHNRSKNSFWALKDVSFDVLPGEVLGIIGRNGAGKSTLLKILSRITKQTAGRVELYGRIGSMLEVGTGFHPELTGRENVFLNGAILGMRRQEIAKKFDEIVDFAEIEQFLDTPVKRYSSGMYMRLAFSVAAFLEPEVLIIDEVLSVGDAKFQKKCLGKMDGVAKQGRTVIFVSHDMSAMMQLCSTALLLKKGRVDRAGSVQSVIDGYLQQEEPQSEATFEGEAIKYARVKQIGEQIEIVADYRCEKEIPFPSLGFVIYDWIGNPVTGRNLMADSSRVSLDQFDKNSGRVRVLINYPKLCDGNYKISLWFGDGVNDDLFYAPYCLFLEVSNMSIKKQLPASINGAAVAECVWSVE